MRHALASLLGLSLLFACPLAFADGGGDDTPAERRVIRVDLRDTPPARPDDAPHARQWYGWQPLLTDASALAIVFMAGAAGSAPIAYVAGADYLIFPPAIHLAHGHPDKAAGSLMLRVAIPGVLAGIFYATTAPPSHDDKELFGNWDFRPLAAMAGAILGMGGAIAIDDAAIAREDVPPPPPDAIVVAPSATAVRGGATFGLSGSF